MSSTESAASRMWSATTDEEDDDGARTPTQADFAAIAGEHADKKKHTHFACGIDMCIFTDRKRTPSLVDELLSEIYARFPSSPSSRRSCSAVTVGGIGIGGVGGRVDGACARHVDFSSAAGSRRWRTLKISPPSQIFIVFILALPSLAEAARTRTV